MHGKFLCRHRGPDSTLAPHAWTPRLPTPGPCDRTDTKVLEEAPLLQQTFRSTTSCSTTLGRKLCGPIGHIATKHFEPAVTDMGGPRTMDRRRP